MANITEEHLHHMARRHHATMKKFEGLQDKFRGYAKGFFSTAEVGAGAWLGGAIEGRTSGGTVLNVPINLGVGALLLVVGHLNLTGDKYSEHINNLGNGFIGSYAAATGYSFGKRWKETGKLLGGGGHPWTHPYENGWAPGAAPAVHGDLSEEHMNTIAQNMQAAAMASAHP